MYPRRDFLKEKSPPVNVLNICNWKFYTYFPATGKYDVRGLAYINLKRGASLIKSVYHGSLFNEVELKVFNCRGEKRKITYASPCFNIFISQLFLFSSITCFGSYDLSQTMHRRVYFPSNNFCNLHRGISCPRHVNGYEILTAPLICTPFNRICRMQLGFTVNSTAPFNFNTASP